MKKRHLAVFLILSALLLISSCTKTQKQIDVYSFNGENEDIMINNGIIVITDDVEKVVGGDLLFKNNEPLNVKKSVKKLFFDKEGAEEVILIHANEIEDNTKGTEIPSELGALSSDDLFDNKDLELIKDSLQFSLSGILINGESFEYKLDLNVKEVYP